MTAAALSRSERKAAHRARLRAALPDLPTLAAVLDAAFEVRAGATVVIDRRPNEYASSFPSEVVTCRAGDGSPRRVLVKVGAGEGHGAHGHRGDVGYEAEVYRRVLQPMSCTAPRWYGDTGHVTGERWLVTEYVDDAVRLADLDDPAALPCAARWIARFHAATATWTDRPELAFLRRYDAEYYRQWAHRTAVLAAGLLGRFPFLAPLCARFRDAVEPLLDAPTVIHGEYAPKNVLLAGERVCPVDWESAAVGAGEVDLASLTDGSWPASLVDECVEMYAKARWSAPAPAAFAMRLHLARLYWNFRWLGERAEWTTSERGLRRIERVRRIGERAGLL